MTDTKSASLIELSEAEIDAVGGGQTTVVGGLAAVLLQISANAALLNVTGGNFTQTTGDQAIQIG